MKEHLIKYKKHITVTLLIVVTIVIAIIVDMDKGEPCEINYDIKRYRKTNNYRKLIEQSKMPKSKVKIPTKIEGGPKNYVDAFGLYLFVKFIEQENKFAVNIANHEFTEMEEVGRIIRELCCHFLMNQKTVVILSPYEGILRNTNTVKMRINNIKGAYAIAIEVAKCIQEAVHIIEESKKLDEFYKGKLDVKVLKEMLKKDDALVGEPDD